MLSLDLSTKIPIKKIINICPTVMFSIVDATFSAENKKGEFMPEGFTVTQPYSTLGAGWSPNYYGEDYLYHLSDASVSQTSLGLFLTKNVSKSIEIGSGFFLKNKSEKIESYKAHDKYTWAFDTQLYDYYDYSETSVDDTPTMVETFKESSVSIPLILQWSEVISGHTYMGASVIGYVSKDTYYSVRMTLGHEF
jgi:hypothetical protein